jgi:hypothetical protein
MRRKEGKSQSLPEQPEWQLTTKMFFIRVFFHLDFFINMR